MAIASFNPSVGILFVHTHTPRRLRLSSFVSIPRSGFCLFILGSSSTGQEAPGEFQSLGRDSVCSYLTVMAEQCRAVTFQSLGRDSVCSYYGAGWEARSFQRFQSLGRDSVCSYNKYTGYTKAITSVSIPRSGFCLFIPISMMTTDASP